MRLNPIPVIRISINQIICTYIFHSKRYPTEYRDLTFYRIVYVIRIGSAVFVDTQPIKQKVPYHLFCQQLYVGPPRGSYAFRYWLFMLLGYELNKVDVIRIRKLADKFVLAEIAILQIACLIQKMREGFRQVAE